MEWNLFIIPVTNILVELIKKTKIASTNWLPWIAVVIGGVLGAIYAAVFKVDCFVYIVEGLIYGASAAGIYDATKSSYVMIKNGKE